jgi:hypothetical protein
MEDEEVDPLLIGRKGKGKEIADAEPPSSQSTESSDTGPQTPEDEEFDWAAIPRLPRPKSPIRRRASSIKGNSTKPKTKTNKPKAKPKTPATAYQISATLAPKPKSKARAKKRTQSADGVLKTSHKAGTGKSKTKGSTSDSALPKPKPAKPITIAPRGATIVNRVAPKTFASLDS